MVQSMPSSQAEVFKRWLARMGAKPAVRHGPQTDLVSVFALLEEEVCGEALMKVSGNGLMSASYSTPLCTRQTP